jgi:hypothetical protein
VNEDHEPIDSLDIWWGVQGVLAGMSMPFIHPQRYDTPGARIDAFPDELPLSGARASEPLSAF